VLKNLSRLKKVVFVVLIMNERTEKAKINQIRKPERIMTVSPKRAERGKARNKRKRREMDFLKKEERGMVYFTMFGFGSF